MKRLSDPFVSSVVALGALGAAGLIILVLAWRGVAADVNVANQVPFLVSGAMGGLGLIGFVFGVLVIQHRRYVEAQRRAEFDQVAAAAAELLAVARRESRGSER